MLLIRKLVLAGLLLGCAVLLVSFEVAEDEILSEELPDIEFENFPGIPERIDTAEEIRSIGRFLGQARELGQTDRVFAGRYRIVRAVDPEETGKLDADIIYLLPDARVDHVDNIRRIIAGYLETTYGYQTTDATLLSRFITIYNAVHRRDMEFFDARYKTVVMANLSPAGAGLPLSWREWPGGSEIVIPIRDPDAMDRLGIISPGELIDRAVLDDLRTRRDMGLEDRRDMIDFFERLIAEEEAEIALEREQIEREREELAEERERIEEEREIAVDDPDTDPDVEPEEPDDPDEIVERERELEEREERLTEREDDVEQLREEVERLREETAEDQELVLEDEEPTEAVPAAERTDLVTLLLVTQSNPAIRSQLVRVEPASGRILVRSTVSDILGRRFATIETGIAAPVADGNAAVLAVFDPMSLSVIRESEDQLHPASDIAAAGSNRLYAVVQEGGSSYLGLFNSDLELLERSQITVRPQTAIVQVAGRLYVQSADNRMLVLNPNTLEQQE
ncbi:P83/100 family protein [Spirochaeta africana]|uniref:Borrelia P83/100 protein n=1 Tax=Spirochaeta africana (strain ATCC 700263 / DSM 8902 / Z-7692) TaxID=889378 RepID=H9UKC6_SPIAZ|nr:P83/100 family protein [Spirochaeta africana]AFG37969.1 Borrelia P83/100 protein [Spirochaeta africana DSM 8902]